MATIENPPGSNKLSSFQYISNALIFIVYAILLAVLLVMFTLPHKPNINQTFNEQSKNNR